MSLKVFHIVFIALAALLSVGFAYWTKVQGETAFGAAAPAMALLAVSAAGVLTIYGIRTLKLKVE